MIMYVHSILEKLRYQNLRNLVNVAISNIWIVIQSYKPKCHKIIDAV